MIFHIKCEIFFWAPTRVTKLFSIRSTASLCAEPQSIDLSGKKESFFLIIFISLFG